MVIDLGGFVVVIFKCGIVYINIFIILLVMVDVFVGGKIGINFNGLKNEIGVFVLVVSVLIEIEFFCIFDVYNFFLGYVEMLKYGLISNIFYWVELFVFDMEKMDYGYLKKLVGYFV